MLNIGLIGKTEIFEPYVKKLQKNRNINIIGKTSVGKNMDLAGFHYSIPETNRIELIERSDIILLDSSSLLPFKMLCDIVKKSKHLFAVEYIKLTIEECIQLNKLANESGSVLQFTNPFYYMPAIQWLNKNLITPTYIDISYINSEKVSHATLISLLLMLTGTSGINPKKIGAVTFRSKQAESEFNNIRLEFGDASVVNINYGNLPPLSEFKVKTYSAEQFVNLNITSKTYSCNKSPIDLSSYRDINETDTFINTIQKRLNPGSSIEDYLTVLSAVQKIDKRITQFSIS